MSDSTPFPSLSDPILKIDVALLRSTPDITFIPKDLNNNTITLDDIIIDYNTWLNIFYRNDKEHFSLPKGGDVPDNLISFRDRTVQHESFNLLNALLKHHLKDLGLENSDLLSTNSLIKFNQTISSITTIASIQTTSTIVNALKISDIKNLLIASKLTPNSPLPTTVKFIVSIAFLSSIPNGTAQNIEFVYRVNNLNF
jgi:hypothetical protein